MPEPDIVWGSLLTAGALYELYTLISHRDGDTFSARMRSWFHTHTRPGRALFALAWTGFALWFLLHIIGG